MDKLEREMADIRIQIATVQKDLNLERQDRCAKQAQAYFQTHWGRPYYLFVTHYSRSLDSVLPGLTEVFPGAKMYI